MTRDGHLAAPAGGGDGLRRTAGPAVDIDAVVWRAWRREVTALLEIAALLIGWICARMNVYSRASVARLTGVEDPRVPELIGSELAAD